MTAPDSTYVDTSVLVAALATDDINHARARRWLGKMGAGFVTSVISEVELARALARRNAPPSTRRLAERLLGVSELIEVTAGIRRSAADLTPASLRSLDALHVATALAAEVTHLATFDARQAVGAEDAGLTLSF